MLYPSLINQRIKKLFCFHLIILIAFIFSACGGSGGGDDNPFTWTDPLMPEISVTQEGEEFLSGSQYDFGNIPLAQERSVQFLIENAGIGPLTIHDMFMFDEESLFTVDGLDDIELPMELQQGESVMVSIIFESEEETDSVDNTFCIFNSDGDDAAFLIDVTGRCNQIIEDETWNLRFDGDGGYDSVKALAVDSLGNVYAAGFGTNVANTDSGMDWWIKKFSSLGAEIGDDQGWDKKLDIDGDLEEVIALAVDSGNNLYVLGLSSSEDFTEDYVHIRKYNSAGVEDPVWNKKIGNISGSAEYIYDYPGGIVVGPGDTIYITGYSTDEYNSSSIFWIKKYGSDGVEDATVFNTQLHTNSIRRDCATAISVDSASGDIYVAGYAYGLVRYSEVTFEESSREDWWVKKFDSSGVEQWYAIIGSETETDDSFSDMLYDIALDASGNLYCAGKKGSDWAISRIDTDNGEVSIDWQRESIWETESAARALSVDGDGNVFAAGYGKNIVGGQSDYDWWVRRLNPAGDYASDLWEVMYDGSSSAGDDAVLALCAYGDSLYAAGYGSNLLSSSDPVSNNDWWIKKFYVDPVDK
ncbi:MAG: hypothetical protein CVV44_06540 [Spirochaetae bacterium HGW-Spirochaetae-1]|jgi:hypothetical protein|nr:MAG: hypothetical protein CVV44_06540 [Spirochaetae bacterium HGW-Spirochaetae-1]